MDAPIKVIFLDVDGVLVHTGTVGRRRKLVNPTRVQGYIAQLDEVCVQRLKDVLEQTGALLVISSTWRLFEDNMAALERTFGRDVILGKTDSVPRKIASGLYLGDDRTAEITQWMAEYEANGGTISHYAAIDDEKLKPPVLERQVFVADGMFLGGMRDRHARKLQALLT